VDFVLIAGDLYDGDWKDFGTGLFFVNEMRRLDKEKIPVYLIYGNHDAESRVTKNLTLPRNVHIYSTREAETVAHPELPVCRKRSAGG
jgi:DNA repair exonuclease SbcCD nuclease subunit